MILIVGLGNPGKDYENQRHNIGFMVVDAVHDHHNFSSYKSKFQGLLAEGTIGDQKAIILKPQTYMNLSGQSVGLAANFYKIKPDDIFVIHDDLDLPFLGLKIKNGGGAGGHNGLKHIDKVISPNYWRLRIGIDHPGQKHLVSKYVLSSFSKDQLIDIDLLSEKISSHFASFCKKEFPNFLEKIKG